MISVSLPRCSLPPCTTMWCVPHALRLWLAYHVAVEAPHLYLYAGVRHAQIHHFHPVLSIQIQYHFRTSFCALAWFLLSSVTNIMNCNYSDIMRLDSGVHEGVLPGGGGVIVMFAVHRVTWPKVGGANLRHSANHSVHGGLAPCFSFLLRCPQLCSVHWSSVYYLHATVLMARVDCLRGSFDHSSPGTTVCVCLGAVRTHR